MPTIYKLISKKEKLLSLLTRGIGMLTMLLSFMAVQFGQAQSVHYDFNEPTDRGFTTENLGSTAQEWERDTLTGAGNEADTAYIPPQAWGTNIGGDQAASANYALVSPPYIATSTDVDVDFYEYRQIDAGWHDHFLEYRVNGGTWQQQYVEDTDVSPWTLNQNTITGLSVGDTIQVRWRATNDGVGMDAGWYIDSLNITNVDEIPVNYADAYAENQNQAAVLSGTDDASILGINIELSGTGGNLSLTDFYFSLGNTTDPADIDAAHLYYAAGDGSFSTAQQFGSTVPTPSGQVHFSDTDSISAENNRFWIAYDVSAGAQENNELDAQFDSVVVGDTMRYPSVTSLPGTREVFTPLSGTYTIGSGGDFGTITDAFASLDGVGIDGPVEFLLIDSLYDDTQETFPIVIGDFDNVNDDSVTFAPDAGVTSVIDGANETIFDFNGTENLFVDGEERLTLTSGNTRAIIEIEAASHLYILNNLIEGFGDNLEAGIWVDGSSEIHIHNNEITNISHDNGRSYGINLDGVSNSTVHGNEIHDVTNDDRVDDVGGRGINVTGPTNNIQISANTIYDINCTASFCAGQGIGIEDVGNNADIDIVNNLIYRLLDGGSTSSGDQRNTWGIHMRGIGSDIGIYYNTILNTEPGDDGNTVGAIWMEDDITGVEIINNILVSDLPGQDNYCVFGDNQDASDLNIIDHNLYYTSGNVGYLDGSSHNSLGDWQTATGDDANSISGNPVLYDPPEDARPIDGSPVIDAGTPLSSYTSDKDGEPRSSTAPFIGAYETIVPGTCAWPTDLAINYLGGDEFELSWNDNVGATEWVIQYDVSGFTLGEGNIDTVTATTDTISGLSGLTTYEFYVRAICPAGGESDWSPVLTYTTPLVCPSGAYCFNHAGATGSSGPDQAAIDSAYANTNLENEVNSVAGFQQWVVPATDMYYISAYGAEGGGVNEDHRGQGGKAEGGIFLEQGDTIYIAVGQAGQYGHLASSPPPGGFGGGGDGGTAGADDHHGSSGGGASDVRIGDTTLANRVIVAGGGGGGTGDGNESWRNGGGGAGGGGYYGGGGGSGGDQGSQAGEGGTQTTGGAGGATSSGSTAGGFGFGGDGGNTTYTSDFSTSTNVFGGDGGGLAGQDGGTNSTASRADGGGGGSSYIDGISGFDLLSASTQPGVHKGHGALLIEPVDCMFPLDPVATNTTGEEIAVSWNDTVNSEWQIAYGAAGFDLDFGEEDSIITTNTTSDTLSLSLTSLANYDFYFRSICGGGDTSIWVGPETITYCADRCFTHAGASGAFGPSQSDVDNAYAGGALDSEVTVVGSGMQKFVVPTTSIYHLDVRGAEGGFSDGNNAPAGKGARMTGELGLTEGDTLLIVVGQEGVGVSGGGGTGGGGSFVAQIKDNDTIPLIIAGGGSGAPDNTNFGELDGQVTNRGPGGGIGHTSTSGSGGGGGWSGDAINVAPGISFLNGAEGGVGSEAEGGFGGGGGAEGSFNDGAGGGGYSGGDHTYEATDFGGGGSYNDAPFNQVNEAGYQEGNGVVVLEEVPTHRHDAALTGLNTQSVVCDGVSQLEVIVSNFGTELLDEVTLNWSVDGTSQPDTTHTGLGIESFQSDTLTIGEYDFTTAPTYELMFATSSPNDTVDVNPENDSLIFDEFRPGLHGVVTVGGASPDFASITDVLNDIDQFGTCDNLLIELYEDNYDQLETFPINIDENVTSAFDTITIRPAAGESPVIDADASAVFSLNNAQNVIIDGSHQGSMENNLTLINQANSDAPDHVIEITGGSENITVQNVMTQGGFTGIGITGANDVLIHGNEVTDILTPDNTAAPGITLIGNVENVTVDANEIHDIESTNSFRGGQGIFVAVNSTNAGIQISNNLIYDLRGEGSNASGNNPWGIYTDGGGGFNIYYNTIVMNGVNRNSSSSPDMGGIWFEVGTNIELINNIIHTPAEANPGGSGVMYAIYSDVGTAAFNSIDYNIYHSDGPQGELGHFNGTDYSDISSWQGATGDDANSHDSDPLIYSIPNIMAPSIGSPANNNGTPLTAVTHDFEGEERNTTDPTIGAFDTPIADDDVGITALHSPQPFDASCDPPNDVFEVEIENFGMNDQSDFDVSVDVYLNNNHIKTVTGTYTDTLESEASDNFVVGNVGALPGGEVTIVAYTQLAGDEVPENDTLLISVDIIDIVEGTPFEGSWSTGIETDPDVVCPNSEVTYELTPPVGFDNTEYNAGWSIIDTSFETASGYHPMNVTFTEPSAPDNGYMSFIPDASEEDSVFIMSATVQHDNTGCTHTVERYLEVRSLPLADFSADNVCFGESVAFSNQTITDGSPEYIWSFGDGDSSFVENPTHTYSDTGTYEVTLTAQFGSDCATTHTETVEVYSLPVADYDANNVCLGDTVSFTNLSVGEHDPHTYTWSFGDGDSSTVENPQHVYDDPGEYEVTLSVTSDVGCTDTYIDTVEVYSLPDAFYTADDVCDSETVNFNNMSTGDHGPHTWNWDFGDGNSSTDENPAHTYADTGSYEVTLTAESIHGCETSYTDTVWVHPVPEAAFTANDECDGDAVIFSNLSTGADSYEWDFGDGNTSTDENPDHTYAEAGEYDVSLVTITNEGCTDTITHTVEIFHMPEAAFAAADECEGNAVSFDNQSSIDDGTLDYHWDFDDGNTSTDEEPTHLYDTAGTYEVTLITTSQAGCADTVTNTVEIYPEVEAAFTANDVCDGEAVQFDNQSTTAAANVAYQWNFGDGNVSAQESPAHTYDDPGQYEVELVTLTAQGCSDTTAEMVEVFEAPEADFTATDDVCAGGTAVFDNQSTGADTYEWDFGDGNTSTAEHPSHTYDNEGSYEVTLVASSDEGCTDTVSHTVEVNPLPVAEIAEVDNVCHEEAVEFDHTSTLTGQTHTFHWEFGDGNSSTDESPAHTYAEAGTYEVTLVVETGAGCADTAMTTVEVYELPNSGFDMEVDRSLPGVEVAAVDDSYETYEWDFGDGTEVTDETTYTHEYVENDFYYITLTVTTAEGCTSTSTDSVDIDNVDITGDLEAEGDEAVTAYPNPFTERATIAYTIDERSNVGIELYDVNGRKVADLKKKGKTVVGTHETELRASDYDLASGTYIVRIQIDDRSYEMLLEYIE